MDLNPYRVPTKKPSKYPRNLFKATSNSCFVSDWYNSLRRVILHRDSPRLAGSDRLPLQMNVGAVSFGLLLQLCIPLNTSHELFSGSGQADVLNSEVDTLLDVSVLDLLVDDDADGGGSDIVDDSSLAVVRLVRHSLLNSTIRLDVDNISNFVLTQVGRQLDHTLLLEIPAEGIAGTRTQTRWVTHGSNEAVITSRFPKGS